METGELWQVSCNLMLASTLKVVMVEKLVIGVWKIGNGVFWLNWVEMLWQRGL